MIIIICNSYPKGDRYRMSQEWSWKDCHICHNEHTAQQAWSIIAKEVRIIEIVDWLDPYQLFQLIRRLRINR